MGDTNLQRQLVSKIVKASEAIEAAKPTYFGLMLIHCTDAEFKTWIKANINWFCSPDQAKAIEQRRKSLNV